MGRDFDKRKTCEASRRRPRACGAHTPICKAATDVAITENLTTPTRPSSKLVLPTRMTWLTYEEAAQFTGLSVRHLRNLVSAEQIPVYGPRRSRRFRLDMLDLFLTDRDAAMRKFQSERSSHLGD
jgi:excisionase family DNA binding protein